MPFTVPFKYDDGPIKTVRQYPGIKEENDEYWQTHYDEGIYVGYRWYEAKGIPVQWAFGHGLSYTTFEFGQAKAGKASMTADGKMTVSVDVKNTGDREGAEVVQLYVADPRFKTLMIMNSGLFINPAGAMPGMPMPEKEKLQNIKVPVIYILGGEEDIAYGNGMDDFFRLKNVPAVTANLPVGHGGTYRQPHGGEFTVPALAWLQWQLQGNEEAAKMFTGSPCGLALREGWTVDKNELMD